MNAVTFEIKMGGIGTVTPPKVPVVAQPPKPTTRVELDLTSKTEDE